MKRLLFAVMTALTLTLASNLKAEESKFMWVSFIVEKDDDREIEYYGQVAKETMESIIKGAKNKFVMVKSVFWYDEEKQKFTKLSQAATKGKDLGYKGSIYLRITEIKCFLPLKDEFVKKLTKQ